jgi:hypothetical protein
VATETGKVEKDYEKVFLHNDGEDVESCWAEPAGSGKGGRSFVRLANIPFLHAKPTYGDIIEVRRDPGYGNAFVWDRGNLPWNRIGERIHSDGGRYAAIVDYTMRVGADFKALTQWLKLDQNVVGEGCFAPEGDRPGRLYLAVPDESEIDDILVRMAEEFGAFAFTRIHPPAAESISPLSLAKPRKKRESAAPKKKTTRKKAATKKKKKKQ